MSFQGYQGDVIPQVEQEILGAEEGTQMMQFTQVQLAQIVGGLQSEGNKRDTLLVARG